MGRNTTGLLRKHELTHKNRRTENSQTTFIYYFFPAKMLIAQENKIVPFCLTWTSSLYADFAKL